jgi:hypothetical protein
MISTDIMFFKLPSLKKIMANFAARVQTILLTLKGANDGLLVENAELKERLAAALADDAADDAAVAAAQAEAVEARTTADAAVAEAERLQALVDADLAEDAALEEVLSAFEEAPATEEVVEAPAAE